MQSERRILRSARARSTTLTAAAQQELREAIANGVYRAGSQLPTEAELGQILGVSRTVVREALRGLVDEGLIDRRHGVGTFVREQAIVKNLNLNFGITDMIRAAGMAPGTASLNVRAGRAGQQVASELQLEPGAPTWEIERVRTADGRAVVFSIDTLSQALWPEAQADRERLRSESLYEVLQAQLGLAIDHGLAWLAPAQATPAIAAGLHIPEHALLLCLTQTDYTAANRPLVFSREYHLPDAFDFVVWRRGPSRQV